QILKEIRAEYCRRFQAFFPVVIRSVCGRIFGEPGRSGLRGGMKAKLLHEKDRLKTFFFLSCSRSTATSIRPQSLTKLSLNLDVAGTQYRTREHMSFRYRLTWQQTLAHHR